MAESSKRWQREVVYQVRSLRGRGLDLAVLALGS
jgi:hypothetical protein